MRSFNTLQNKIDRTQATEITKLPPSKPETYIDYCSSFLLAKRHPVIADPPAGTTPMDEESCITVAVGIFDQR
jgi:hypothetical protein